jgi:hypothetical protein
MRLQESVVGRSVEEIDCDIGIGFWSNCSALDGSIDHGLVLCSDGG